MDLTHEMSGPAWGLDRFSRQIATERPTNSNAANDRQEGFAARRKAVDEACADFDVYRRLRLAELNDPAVTQDFVWRRTVRVAYATFCDRFHGLRP